MKRYFSIGVLVALAALLLGACSKDVKEELVGEQFGPRTVSFNVSMADQTRTGLAFKFVPYWTENDVKNVHLFESYKGETVEGHDVTMDIEEDRHGEVAHFSADFSEDMVIIVNPPSSQTSVVATRAESNSYTYTGIFAQKVDNKFTVPSTQKPDSKLLIDPTADFLIGSAKQEFAKSQTEKDVDLFFVRPVAVSRLAIMNVEQGTKIMSVKITSTDKLTGAAAYGDVDFENGTVAFDAQSGSTEITLDYGEGVENQLEKVFYAYFVSLQGAKKITSIEVTTDTHVYTKTMPDGGSTLTFKENDFKNIAVDMSKVTPTPAGQPQPQAQDIHFYKGNGVITTDSFVLGGTYVSPTLGGAAEGATVTYSIACDPAGVATVSETGVVTPAAAGTAVITATASAVEGFKETSVSYTLSVTEAEPVDQELKFVKGEGQDQQEFDEENGDTFDLYPAGGEYSAPTLTGVAEGATVTYSIACTPEGVATINETTGVVTPAAVGTAIITATASAVTGYNAATKSYKLTVSDSTPAEETTYYLTAKPEDVVSGDYLVVSYDYDRIFDGSGDNKGGFTLVTADGISADKTAGTITVTNSAKTSLEFAITRTNNTLTLKNALGFLKHNGANDDPTFITFDSNSGSSFTLDPTITTDANKAIYFWTPKGSNSTSTEYLYYKDSGSGTLNVFKIGGSGNNATKGGVHLYFAGERSAQTVNFEEDEYTYDLADNGSWSPSAPAVSGDHFTELVYTSSNENVIYYENGWKFGTSAKKGATAKIFVTAPASDKYLSAMDSVVVTIDNSASTAKTFYKASAIEVGDEYVIVSAGQALKNNGHNAVVAAVAVEVANNTITLEDEDGVLWKAADVDPSLTDGATSNPRLLSEYGLYTLSNGSEHLWRYSSSGTFRLQASNAAYTKYMVWNYDGTYLTNHSIYTSGSSTTHSDYYAYYSNGWTISTTETPASLFTVRKPYSGEAPSFASSTATLDLANQDQFNAPQLNNIPLGWTVVYQSSDESIVTVDNNGAITPKEGAKSGDEVTISALVSDPNKEYQGAKAEYTLNITNSNVPTYYKADEVVNGRQYLIVSNKYALKNNNGSAAATNLSTSIEGDVIKYDPATSELWTATVSSGSITFKNDTRSLYRSSSNISLSTSSASSFTYDADNEYLTTKGSNSTYYLYYGTSFQYSTTANKAVLYSTTVPLPKWDISYDVDAAEYDQFTQGWTPSMPVLTTTATNVTYASSDETVATVSATGQLTVLKMGETKITATAAADATHKKTEASYTLTVVSSDPDLPKYTKVTSTSDLTAGAKYLLVFEGLANDTDGDGDPKVFKANLNSNGSQFAKATESALPVKISNSTIASNGFGDNEFTLETGYYLKGDKANKYIYPGSASNSSVMLAESSASHALTIEFSNGIAQIKNGNYYLVWSTSSHYFSCNTAVSGQYSTGICLYKLEGSGGSTPEPSTDPSTYTQISFADGITTGKYLIVNPADAQVFTAVTSNPNAEAVTPASGVITGEYDNYEFTITTSGNTITIQNASGQYLYYVYTSGSTASRVAYQSTANGTWTPNSVASDTNGFNLTWESGNSTQHIYWNDTFFKIGSQETGVHLYKKNSTNN